MERLELNGHIDDAGVLHVQNRDRLVEWARHYPGKNVVIRFERKSSKRSSPQNRYYFGVVVKEITLRLRELGHTWIQDEDVHELMKLKFNYEQIVSEHGEVMELPKSTAMLTKTQFAEYVDRIRMWASDFLGLEIPDPNQDLTMQF
jgi:hypothetical protein